MKKRLFAVLCTMIMLMSAITPGVLADGEYRTGAELYKEGMVLFVTMLFSGGMIP